MWVMFNHMQMAYNRSLQEEVCGTWINERKKSFSSVSWSGGGGTRLKRTAIKEKEKRKQYWSASHVKHLES